MLLVLFICYRLNFDARPFQIMNQIIHLVFLGAYLFSTIYSKMVSSHRQPTSLRHPFWDLSLPVVISQTFFVLHLFLCRSGTRLKSKLHKQRNRLRGPIVRRIPFYLKSSLKPKRNRRGIFPSSSLGSGNYLQPCAHSASPESLLNRRKNDTC